MKRKYLVALVALTFIFTALFAGGGCADDISRDLNEDNGKLRFEPVYGADKVVGYAVTGIGEYSGTEVLIPEKHNDKPVVEIKDNAFAGNARITYVDMCGYVTKIGDYAFYGCKNLRAIGLSENLVKVGLGAFGDCGSLEYNVYDNGNYLGNDQNPFLVYVSPSKSAKEYTLSADTKLIYGQAFDKTVEKITLPKGLKYLSGYSFRGCDALETVVLPKDNTDYFTDGDVITDKNGALVLATGSKDLSDKEFSSVAPYAFTIYRAEAINLPDAATAIEDSAFAYAGAKTVRFGKHVESIGAGIFYRADKLTTISDFENDFYRAVKNCVISVKDKAVIAGCGGSEIPADASVTSVGKQAFYACGTLKSIFVPRNIVKLGSKAFYFCTALESVGFAENGLKQVGEHAFTLCRALKSIYLPEGLTHIFDGAFSTSGVEEITLPSTLLSIGEGAFGGCADLKKITFSGTREQFESITVLSGNEALDQSAIIYKN